MGRTAKVLATAALALGGVFAATSPAMATGDLVDVKVGDITVLENVDVDVAALVCGISLDALVIDLHDGDDEAACPSLGGKVIKK